MTWHTIFDMSTLEGRHLVAAYTVAFLLQGGYFAWTLYNWRLTRKPRV